MFCIKILNRRNHPYTNKIKVYGVNIEAILIGFFILIVFFYQLFTLADDIKIKKK